MDDLRKIYCPKVEKTVIKLDCEKCEYGDYSMDEKMNHECKHPDNKNRLPRFRSPFFV